MSHQSLLCRHSRIVVIGIALVGGVCSLAAEGEGDRLTSRRQPPVPNEKAIVVGTELRTEAGQRRRVTLPGGAAIYVNERSTLKLTEKRRLVLTEGEILIEAAQDKETPLIVQAPQREISGHACRFTVRVEAAGTGIVVTGGQVKVGDTALRAGQQLLPKSDKPAPAVRIAHRLDWARDLMATAETPLVPKSSHTGGALLAVDPDGQEMKLGLRKYHVDVHVEDGFARTTIDQTYFNHEAQRLEGTFYFPLPADASLSRLAMYVDGNLMEGGMAERDYARNVYEEIVHRQKDPALLEWVDGSTFKMRVFPLEARQEKRIVLSYTQRLPAQYGRHTYRFPSGHNLGLVQEWSFRARVKDGADLAWNAAGHSLKARTEDRDLVLDAAVKGVKLDRDVVVTLQEKATGDEADLARFSSAELDGAKYLMLRYRPILPGQPERQRRDWVFLFESSGDRDPLLARVQVDVVRGLLSHAGPDDTFAVLAAGTRVATLEPRPVTPDSVAAAVAFLENVHLVGALDLEKALSSATTLLKGTKDPHLVHLGSGIAALGEQRIDRLVALIPQETRYVGVGVGRRWARNLMKSAAEKTGGAFTQINPDEPVSWRTFELAASLDGPRLLTIHVADKAGKVFLSETNAITQGEEVCAFLRASDELPQAVTITGTVAGRPFERTLPVKDIRSSAGYLPRTWAKLDIDRLLAEDAIKHKAKIVELSKAMYVMTPFTSLLVLENEEMYARYKVDRGRKDHWALYPCPAKVPVVYEPLPGMPADARNLAKASMPNVRQVLNTISATALNSRFPAMDFAQVPRALTSDLDVPLIQKSGFRYGMAASLMDASFSAKPTVAYYTAVDLTAYRSSELNLEPPGRQRLYMSESDAAMQARMQQQRAYQGMAPVERMMGVTLLSRQPATVGQIFIVGNEVNRQERGLPDLRFTNAYDINALGTRFDGGADRRFANWSLGLRVNSDAGLTGSIVADQRRFGGHYLQHRPQYFVQNVQVAGGGEEGSSPDRPFFDLAAYCPGLSPTTADVQAVIEAEAALDARDIPGRIDDGARKLIDRARLAGWQALMIPAENGQQALTITFDGSDRYSWERTLPPGVRERVACDGKTLTHLYPDLGIGARRTVGRAHRVDLAGSVPWVVPSADDLARGTDLRALDERTVAIVPRGADEAKDAEGKPLPHVRLHLIFAANGALAERKLVKMPGEKALARETLAADGTVKVFDADGKEKAVRKWKLAPAAAPELVLDTKGLVVLPLPYRTVEFVNERIKQDKKEDAPISPERALELLAAEFAKGNAGGANTVFREQFFKHEKRQIGFYVLLAACGNNLDAEHGDVLAEHPNEPLAQYLALYSSPVLRKHASQWAVGTGQWKEGYLQHLAVTHALLQRWQNGKALSAGAAQRGAETEKALAFVRKNKTSPFAWALLGLMQERATEEEKAKRDTKDLHQTLAEAFALCAEAPDDAYAARYEHARHLFKAEQTATARQKFRTLYDETLKEQLLPLIDTDFRQALLGSGQDKDEWSELVRQTGAKLVEDKRRPAVLLLARQCWHLGDEPLANHLLGIAIANRPDDKQNFDLYLAGIDFLVETNQYHRAADHLQGIHPKGMSARTWRLAAQVAERRDKKGEQFACLEQALDAEFRDLPEVIDLSATRKDYEKLLEHYESLAEAMVTLKVAAPADFRAKVVKVADRWRALDDDGTSASQAAARILHLLGDRELAWDYLTTPVGKRPGESAPWVSLAQALGRRGDLDLADRAFAAAFAAEPTDAQILWDRAQNLRQAGKRAAADKLLRQLVEGNWQPRFHALQGQARWQLTGR